MTTETPHDRPKSLPDAKLPRGFADRDALDVAATERMLAKIRETYVLYGFDVLLDGDLQPWLLEVNTGPNLAAPTPLDVHVKCRVAAEMLHLAGISPPAEPGAAQPPPPPQGGPIPPPSAPLAQQPLAVRQMVAEEGRCGGFERIFPSRKAEDNARLLPLLQPPCALTAACCAYVAHTASGQ